MKNLIVLAVLVLAATGCQMKQKVMDASMVSMTHTHVPEGMKLSEAGPVSGKFCPQGADRGNIGLFDQAVKSAQDKGGIDFISNASFWRDESGCVLLEGTGQKLMASNATVGSTAAAGAAKIAPAKAVPKKKGN